MSKYTTQVRFICENFAGLSESKGYNDVKQIIHDSREKVFDFDYPIFDPDYKPLLEEKILKHFYTREICEETVGLWKLRLDSKMNEIMPYYNQLYKSELLEFDPLKDTDILTVGDKDGTSTHNIKVDGTDSMTGTVVDDGSKNSKDSGADTDSNTNTTSDAIKNDHWDYYSDTPQGQVGTLANLQYLTNARHITDDGTGSLSTSHGNSTKNYGKKTDIDIDNTRTYNTKNDKDTTTTKNIKDINEYTEHVTGKRWADSYSSLLLKFRETFLNIDLLILDELEELFLQIW